MASELTAIASYNGGMQSQAFPFFGGERRGAPVKAFARIDTRPIKVHSQIYNPDILVILDAELLRIEKRGVSSTELKEGGSIVMNLPSVEEAGKYAAGLSSSGAKLFYVDATGIARRLGLVVAGWPVINTAMLGALVRATGIVKLEDMLKAISGYWEKPLADRNIEAAKTGYDKCLIFSGARGAGGL